MISSSLSTPVAKRLKTFVIVLKQINGQFLYFYLYLYYTIGILIFNILITDMFNNALIGNMIMQVTTAVNNRVGRG